MKMIKSILITISGIVVSRMSGFIRDLLIAKFLGVSVYSDIFVIILKIPNMFRLMFLEGTFTQVFLPIFIRSKNKALFLTYVSSIILSFVLIVIVFTQIFPEFIINIIVNGFSSEAVATAVPYMRIDIFYLLTISISIILSTLLTYKHHFFITSYSSILWNLSIIVMTLLCSSGEKGVILYYISYGVIIGGALQAIMHFIGVYRLNLHKLFIHGVGNYVKNRHKIKDEKHKFKKNIKPALLGNVSLYSTGFILTILGSYCVTGTISHMYYSDRIFQLPLAVFAIAISKVLFPKIAKFIKDGMVYESNLYMLNSMSALIFLLLTSTFFGIVYSREIIKLLFYRGSFTLKDVAITAMLLKIYMIGLLPIGLNKIIKLYLYANNRVASTAKISLINLVVTVSLALILLHRYRANGLIVAQDIGSFVAMFLYFYYYGFSNIVNLLKNKKSFFAIICSLILLIIFIYLRGFVRVYI